MAQIIVDDEKVEVELPLTIAEYITQFKVFQPEMATFQLNEELVEKDALATTALNDGDRLDVLYFMGGGSL